MPYEATPQVISPTAADWAELCELVLGGLYDRFLLVGYSREDILAALEKMIHRLQNHTGDPEILAQELVIERAKTAGPGDNPEMLPAAAASQTSQVYHHLLHKIASLYRRRELRPHVLPQLQEMQLWLRQRSDAELKDEADRIRQAQAELAQQGAALRGTATLH